MFGKLNTEIISYKNPPLLVIVEKKGIILTLISPLVLENAIIVQTNFFEDVYIHKFTKPLIDDLSSVHSTFLG